MLRSSLFLLLPACLINTELYEQRLDELTDNDKDGFREDDGDCNDTDPNVYPKAPELCDNQDNDCNGRVDEKPVDGIFYEDRDGDGYGEETTAIATCAAPEGYVATAGDCQDRDSNRNPDALERCNDRDDDCDGDIDEPSAIDARTWYLDADGDGHAGTEGAVVRCTPPDDRYRATAADCNDADPLTFPGADELCDSLDNNCDGDVDEPPTIGEGSWYRDADGDGFGDPADSSCTEVPGYVSSGGDCDDAGPDIHPDAEEVCNDGIDNNCNNSVDGCAWPSSIYMPSHTTLSGQGQCYFARSGAAGDLDGDGATEVVLGAEYAPHPTTGVRTGLVVAFEEPFSSDKSMSEAALEFTGTNLNDGFGLALGVGDINQDGYDDLVASSASASPGGVTLAGSVHVFYGPIADPSVATAAADWRLNGAAAYDVLGLVVSLVGDTSGEGRLDFVAGYPSMDTSAGDGGLYLFSAAGTGSASAPTAATAFLRGSTTAESFGDSAAGLDFNGDGFDDIAVGASGSNDYSGGAFLFYGPVTGTLSSSDADLSFSGEVYISQTGSSLDNAGDLDGDGIEDLVVGGWYVTENGAVYIVHGSTSRASGSLSDADLKIRGDSSSTAMGYLVRGVGDLDGDGALELLAGEGHEPPSNLHLFFGPLGTGIITASNAGTLLEGERTADTEFSSAFNPGDVTGDGVPDLVVGTPTSGVDNDGAAYIISGFGL